MQILHVLYQTSPLSGVTAAKQPHEVETRVVELKNVVKFVGEET